MPKGYKSQPIAGLYCPACGEQRLYIKGGDVAQSGRKRYMCQACGARTTKPLDHAPQRLPEFKKQPGCRRFIITSAVNDTPVVRPALDTYRHMADAYGAQLVVVATLYRNPDAVRHGFLESVTWPAEVLPYICDREFSINRNLVVRGDSRIRVTAINPLAGANHAGAMRSEIFGHPQVAMELVPTPKNSIPKMLTTTGTVSQANYGGSFSAKKAEFHHSISALLVEVVGDKFWCRRLGWDGQGVQDLKTYWTPDGEQRPAEVEAVVYGDIHEDVLEPGERRQLMSIIAGMGARYNVLHDLLDMHSGSHHTEGQPLHYLHAKHKNIRQELDGAVEFLRRVPGAVVVESNHHDHLDQWFNRYNPRRPDHNLPLYYELAHLSATAGPGSLFRLYCQARGVDCQWTNANDEFEVAGRDLSQHGHRGPNGARGSAKAFAKTGRKTVIGHSHTPREEKGSMQVGTAGMSHEYATGYSSWAVAHAVGYPNGKWTLIFSVGGKLSPMVEAVVKCSTK